MNPDPQPCEPSHRRTLASLAPDRRAPTLNLQAQLLTSRTHLHVGPVARTQNWPSFYSSSLDYEAMDLKLKAQEPYSYNQIPYTVSKYVNK